MIKVKVNPLIVAILISLATGSTFYLMAGYWLANSPLACMIFIASSIVLMVTFSTRRAILAYAGLHAFILGLGYAYSIAFRAGAFNGLLWRTDDAWGTFRIALMLCALLLFAGIPVVKFLTAFFKMKFILRWKEVPAEPISERYGQGYQWLGGGKIQEDRPLRGQRRRSYPIPPLELPQQQ